MTTQQEVTPQWQNFLDLANDVKPYLQFGGVSVSETENSQLQETIDMCCQWVQTYLGRPIAPTEFWRRFSGWTGMNGSSVMLPYYPVLEVKKVIEYWGSSGPHELTEQTPASQGGQEVFQLEPLTGRLIRTFTGLIQRPWFPGSRNIEVTWVAGYNPVPTTVRRATLELIAHWWRNTQQASRSGPMPQGYDPEVAAVAGMWAGVPNRVVNLLSPFEQQGIG
jgi:hypothetical protein